MTDNIKIVSWTGAILFSGDYRDEQVDMVLDANRCVESCEAEHCPICEGTGYSGDFSVYWEDENKEDNVYEFINY